MRVGVRKGIYRYPYMKHLIEVWPYHQEDKLGNINESFREKNERQQESMKAWTIINIFLMSSLNVMGELFWSLPIGRKDKRFG